MGPAQWLAMAHDDLRAAELLAEHGIAQLSCFHCEQAVEKALMALRLHGERREGLSLDDASTPVASAETPEEAAHGKGIALEAVQNAQLVLDRIKHRLYGDC